MTTTTTTVVERFFDGGGDNANNADDDDDCRCYLIRNALTVPEQLDVFRDVMSRSAKTRRMASTNKKKCMNPTPAQTILFDDDDDDDIDDDNDGGGEEACAHRREDDAKAENHRPPRSTLRFEISPNDGDDEDEDGNSKNKNDNNKNVYNELIVARANSVLFQNVGEKNNGVFRSKTTTTGGDECSSHYQLSVGAIRYPAPDGKFPDHVDHCNDERTGWVYLLGLGCSANFAVGIRSGITKKKSAVVGETQSQRRNRAAATTTVFEFRSGDILVFDPSTNASVLHGVRSVREGTCPNELLLSLSLSRSSSPDEEAIIDTESTNIEEEECDRLLLKHNRFGIQCRVKNKKKMK